LQLQATCSASLETMICGDTIQWCRDKSHIVRPAMADSFEVERRSHRQKWVMFLPSARSLISQIAAANLPRHHVPVSTS
jgi:hypothetical protein